MDLYKRPGSGCSLSHVHAYACQRHKYLFECGCVNSYSAYSSRHPTQPWGFANGPEMLYNANAIYCYSNCGTNILLLGPLVCTTVVTYNYGSRHYTTPAWDFAQARPRPTSTNGCGANLIANSHKVSH